MKIGLERVQPGREFQAEGPAQTVKLCDLCDVLLDW